MIKRLLVLWLVVAISAAYVPGYDLSVTSTDPLCGGFTGILRRRADSKG